MAKNFKQQEGLGDTIEWVAEKTGIKKVVEKATKGRCGCEKRRLWFNRNFKYKK